MKSFV